VTSEDDPYRELLEDIKSIPAMLAAAEGYIAWEVRRQRWMAHALEYAEHEIPPADGRYGDQDPGQRLDARGRQAEDLRAALALSQEFIDRARTHLHMRRKELLRLVSNVPATRRRAVLRDGALVEHSLLVLIEVDDSLWNVRRAHEAMGGSVPLATLYRRFLELYRSGRLDRVEYGIYARVGGSAQALDGREEPAVVVPPSEEEQRLREATLMLMTDGGDRTWGTEQLARRLGVEAPLIQRVLGRLASEKALTSLGAEVWAPAVEWRRSPRIPARERMLSLMTEGDQAWNVGKLKSALGDIADGTLVDYLLKLTREEKIVRLGDGWHARLGSLQPTQQSLKKAVVQVVSESGQRRALTALEIEQLIQSRVPQVESERLVVALRGVVRRGRLQRTKSRGKAPVFALGTCSEAR
jgi:hypothetical protein